MDLLADAEGEGGNESLTTLLRRDPPEAGSLNARSSKFIGYRLLEFEYISVGRAHVFLALLSD